METLPLTLIIVFAILLILGLILFLVKKNGKLGKATFFYLLGVIIIFGLLGGLSFFNFDMKTLLFSFQIIFFLIGSFQTWMILEKFPWSQSTSVINRHSILPEFGFMLFASLLGLLILLGVFWYSGNMGRELLQLFGFLGATIIPLPFAMLKTFDFAVQIPEKEFANHWEYPTNDINYSRWDWDNNTIFLEFQLHKNHKAKNRFFSKMASHTLKNAPRDKTLGDIFQCIIQEYQKKHQDHPGQKVSDIRSDNVNRHWWLFYVKLIPWKPKTWSRQIKYLDPDDTLAKNLLEDGDVIVAKRRYF